MINVLLVIVGVVLINLGLSLWVRKESTAVSNKWAWKAAFILGLRLVIFFIGAQMVWLMEKRPGFVVFFIFTAAITQMALHITLHLKGKI